MLRTQISLTEEDKRVLDAEAARTGRSMSALIRKAINATYATERSSDDDIAAMRTAFGAWAGRPVDGKTWVDGRRSGARLRP